VKFDRELAVGLLDVRGRRVLGNAESGVVVLLDHVANTHGAPPLFMMTSDRLPADSTRRVRRIGFRRPGEAEPAGIAAAGPVWCR